MNLAEIAPYFSDEGKAIEFVESLIWPNGPVCPHCGGTEKAYRIKANPEKRVRLGLWKCGQCRKQFSVKVGSIFEGSHIPMTKWLMAIYVMCSSKKGISAKQLERSLGISYKASWFLCQRIRYAMSQPPLLGKLGQGGGIVEVDETFVGGKKKNNKHRRKPGSIACQKYPVMTLIDREGDVRTFKAPNTKKSTLKAVALPNIDGTAHITTDHHG